MVHIVPVYVPVYSYDAIEMYTNTPVAKKLGTREYTRPGKTRRGYEYNSTIIMAGYLSEYPGNGYPPGYPLFRPGQSGYGNL